MVELPKTITIISHTNVFNHIFFYRTKPQSRGQMASLYYEEPKKPPKVITWDEANNARPPLRIDMEGPGPCTYSAHNVKPLNETNSPVWTFGGKCDPERGKI